MDPIELLLDLLVEDGRYPPAREVDVQRVIRTRRAFLESDKAALKVVAGWPKDRDYRLDPLPELIADTWADHLWCDDPEVEPAAKSDAGALELLLEANEDLTSGLHAAERVVCGEGEAWWRIYSDREVSDAPLLEWHSRDAVIPYYVGSRLLAVALVSELPTLGRQKATVYRHLEVHADGRVEHVLFKGTRNRIGSTVPLETHPDLADLASSMGAAGGEGQVWQHGLPMLMGRVLNGRGLDRKLKIGVSDYARIEDVLLDLNETATIGAANARLTAKRRVVVPEESLSNQPADLIDNGDGSFRRAAGDPTFDAGEDVLVVSKLDAELGQGGEAPFKVLEYSFDAAALIAWKRDLVETALTRIGLTPRYVGVNPGETMGVLSGTAYKLTLTPTTKAGKGKARPWDDRLPVILSLMAQVDALPEADGGFGRSWSDPASPPSVERGDPLPVDEVEAAQVETALVNAGIRSVFTSVQAQHPDWDDALVEAEVARIREDRAAGGGAGTFGTGLA